MSCRAKQVTTDAPAGMACICVCVETFSGISRDCSCVLETVAMVLAPLALRIDVLVRRERREYRPRCNYKMISSSGSSYLIESATPPPFLRYQIQQQLRDPSAREGRSHRRRREKWRKFARKKRGRQRSARVTHSRRRGPGSPSLRKLQKLAMARSRKYLVIIVGGSTTGHYTCIHVHRGQRWRQGRWTGRSTFPFIGVDIKCNSSWRCFRLGGRPVLDLYLS